MFVFVKGNVSQVLDESGIDDAEINYELLACPEDFVDFFLALLKNSMLSVPRQQSNNEDRANAEMTQNVQLGNLTLVDKKRIRSSSVVGVESRCTKKQPANTSPYEILRILSTNSNWLNHRMDMNGQRRLKSKTLELKAEYTRQEQAFQLQRLEL